MKKFSQHQRDNIAFYVKEKSWVARVAAARLRSEQVAIVIGKTIHLWNVDTETFLTNPKWLRHELCHIRQFQRFGFVGFILKYIVESIQKGYHNNKYEVEARAAEN